ncbi:MAG TPA: hypothetical protein VE961_01080 [Pyrinomonadaceae bacterium]|nr:hypothetical protein [Pyrinomonadaceae bacterium]
MKRPLLTLKVAPSFQDGFVLTLMEDVGKNSSSYVLRYEEIKLRSSRDVGPAPSATEDSKVTVDEACSILQLLAQASIAVAPAYTLGLDGIGFQLEVMRGLNTGHYHWWQTIPEGWEALATISNALLRLAGKPELS